MTPEAGNAALYPETVDLIDDSDPPNASNFNVGHEGNLNRTAWLRSNAASEPAQEWHLQYPYAAGSWLAGGEQQLIAATWDPFNVRWLVAMLGKQAILTGTTPSEIWIGTGLDGNTNWALVTGADIAFAVGSTPTSMAVTCDPVTPGTYYLAVVCDDTFNNGFVKIYRSIGGGAWTLVLSGGVGTTGSDNQKVEFAVIGTTIVLGVSCDGGSNPTKLLFLPHGGVWNSYAAASQTVVDWILCTNGTGTLMLALPAHTSGLHTADAYYTSPDGQTWTARVWGPSLGTTGQMVGLVWTEDVNGPCWVMAVWDSITTKTTFWRSSDGLAWVSQATPTTAFKLADMVAIGPLICGTLADNGSGGAADQIYSVDGGITWYFGQATLSSSSASSNLYYTRPRAYSSGSGFLFLNNLWVRFSAIQRLPFLHL